MQKMLNDCVLNSYQRTRPEWSRTALRIYPYQDVTLKIIINGKYILSILCVMVSIIYMQFTLVDKNHKYRATTFETVTDGYDTSYSSKWRANSFVNDATTEQRCQTRLHKTVVKRITHTTENRVHPLFTCPWLSLMCVIFSITISRNRVLRLSSLRPAKISLKARNNAKIWTRRTRVYAIANIRTLSQTVNRNLQRRENVILTPKSRLTYFRKQNCFTWLIHDAMFLTRSSTSSQESWDIVCSIACANGLIR